MELRHLRYFLTVAQDLNFTRASERLCMTQPPLTQQIKALEAELGVDLFDRSSYRVQLTAAGRVFAAEASRILGDVRTAVQAAQHAARGATGSIRIGFTESSSFNPVVAGSLRRFRIEYPEAQIALEENPSLELITAIRERRMDAAFVRPPLPESTGIAFVGLQDEPMVVAVPSSHPLGSRNSIELRDLASETFILYPRAVRPGLADAIVAACEQAGFRPRVGQHAPQLSSTINLIAASLGISIVPKSMNGMQQHIVSYVPLSGALLAASLGIAYRTAERAHTVLNFVRVAEQVQVQCG